jgi:hypothetical protein
MLDAVTLRGMIIHNLTGKQITGLKDADHKDVTVTISGTDNGTFILADAIAQAVVEYIHSNLEITQGQFTLTGGSMTGALVGTGGGPAPVAVTGGTVSSETGTVSILPGAFK